MSVALPLTIRQDCSALELALLTNNSNVLEFNGTHKGAFYCITYFIGWVLLYCEARFVTSRDYGTIIFVSM